MQAQKKLVTLLINYLLKRHRQELILQLGTSLIMLHGGT